MFHLTLWITLAHYFAHLTSLMTHEIENCQRLLRLVYYGESLLRVVFRAAWREQHGGREWPARSLDRVVADQFLRAKARAQAYWRAARAVHGGR